MRLLELDYAIGSGIFVIERYILISQNIIIHKLSMLKFRRKYTILIGLYLMITLQFAQAATQEDQQITAVLLDEQTLMPIGQASAVLHLQNSDKVLHGVQSRENGALVFPNLDPGTYHLRISYLGYETINKENIVVLEGKATRLGNMYMTPEGQTMEAVVIQAEVPAMQLGIDRKIFNVEQSMVSVGGSATDLLSNVPSLEVDMDGSVNLRGSTGVKILIDGRESAMAGNDITQLLQSMPASSIERVEVVTNPSSRYDAEGQSGIINIVLKKNTRLGMNGAVNASAGSYNNYSAGVNLNYRDGRFNYYGNYNFRHRNNIGDGMNSTRILSTNSLTNNVSESRNSGLNNGLKLGVDHYITDRTVLGLSGNLSVRKSDDREDILYSYLNHPQHDGNSNRFSREEEDDLGFDLNLDFKHEFGRQGEELVANLGFGSDSEEGQNLFDQSFASLDSEHRINQIREKGKNFNIQFDYARPLNWNGDSKLETGYRTNIRMSDDHQYSLLGFNNGALLPDYNVSNDFENRNQVHALYANFQTRFNEKLGVQIGLRAEHASLSTAFTSLDPEVPVSERTVEGNLDYFRLYPSVFLTQEFGEQNQVQASYTRRVRRPRGWQVNPFIDISEPLNIRQGNPNLLPEDIHSFELSYAKFWNKVTLTSSVYHRLMRDVVQSIIMSVDEVDGATYSQWQNISRNQTSGFELISQLDLHKNIDVMLNLNAFHSRFHGSEAFNIAPSEGFSWNANATTNVKLTPNISGQARFEYRAPRITPQGKGIESYVVNAGLRWDILNKRGSVMFNVRDLLNQRRWGGYTHSENVYREYEGRRMQRMFTLSFSYRFGYDNAQRNNRPNAEDFDDDDY